MSDRSFTLSFGVNDREMSTFTRELAVLLDSGMQIVDALELLAEHQKNRSFSRSLRETSKAILHGRSFSDAAKEQPKAFSPLFVAMISAGEVGGKLPQMLRHLTDYYEGQADLKSRIMQALLYPVIVFCVAVVVVIFMMLYVVPIFVETLNSLDADLPASTQLLVGFSKVLVIILPVLIGIILVLILLRFIMKDRPVFREKWDAVCLRIPFYGRLILTTASIRLAEVLHRLIAGGVNLLLILDICADVAHNMKIKTAILSVKEAVRQGYPLSVGFEQTGVFDPVFCQMLKVGENAGNPEQVTERLAVMYRDRLERRVKTLSTVLEPVMLIVVGLLVLFLVVSVMSPIYGIYQNYLNMGM